MKKSDIRIGREYAVKVAGRYRGEPKQIVRATVVRPSGKSWLIHREGDEAARDRTEPVSPQAVIQPWTEYCIDTAHDEAIRDDRMRDWRAEYDAEQKALAAHRKPFIEALQGIPIPAGTVRTGGEDETLDLGEYLHETFVEGRASGSSFSFDVFEAVAREILDLRETIVSLDSGWDGEAEDTGVAVLSTAHAVESEG